MSDHDGCTYCDDKDIWSMCSLCEIVAWYVGGVTVPDPKLTPEQEAAVLAYCDEPGEDNEGPTYHAMVAAGLPRWGTRT